MEDERGSTRAQRQKDVASAASQRGTDDEAVSATPSARPVEMAREAGQKIDGADKRVADEVAVERAHLQRGSSSPYGKEEHLNEELAKQKAADKVEEDPSEQPS